MTQSILANWNGTEMPLDDVRVSVMDRAFLFGDAIYEVLRVYGGRTWLHDEHFARFKRSLTQVQIPCDADRLQGRVAQTLRNSGVDNGIVYIQVTRGVAARTHHFPDFPVEPNELIYIKPIDVDPYAAYREGGASVITHSETRWARRDIKSVNLLANCLASQAAKEAGSIDAIFVADDGELTEGTHTSLFGVRDGQVLTSPTGPHILPGVTRRCVLNLAERAGVPVVEEPLRTHELSNIDELFLTGTTTELLPITKVDGQAIGNGKPGPITQRLYSAFGASVAEWLEQAD